MPAVCLDIGKQAVVDESRHVLRGYVGTDELLAELGKAHLVFRRIDELENLRSFDE